MTACIAEDNLLDLARARTTLAETPALEAHLADCGACSALLCSLLAAPAEPRRDLAGMMLGPYRLDALIGAGAMGEVYRAWDERLHRNVAIKALSRRFAESPERVRRLEAEARAAAAIAHPNVVTVYDTGTDADVPYIVSELITGESLRSVIDRGPIAAATVLGLVRQLVRGIAAAHAQGVVHRDLKPSNLIVTGDGTIKILDFGLAKLVSDRATEETEPGTLLGTSGYLAPEQARGEPADARSDIFAIGAIAYELASGTMAFGGVTFADRLSAVLRDTPPELAGPLGPIIARCLDKDPARRFQSANDLAWVLDGLEREPAQLAKGVRGVSRRSFLVGIAASTVGGIALGSRLFRGSARARATPGYRQLTFRQGRVASARFTRDGDSIVYGAAWDDAPTTLHIARLAGGGTRPLELPPAHLLAVSSRGELALSIDHHFVEGFHQQGQLALAPLEGGQPRRLGLDVQDADFTPDGELAIVRAGSAGFRLELPAGRVLFEAGWISNPRVSPNGDLVACCVHDSPDDDRGDVVVVPTGGGGARTIAAGWSSLDGVAWAAHARHLWISASRDGGNNAVRALTLEGQPLATVPSAGRLRAHDAAGDGRLAVTQVSGRLRMMVKPPNGAREVDLSLSDVSQVADLAADGTQVVFAEFGDVDTANGAYVRSTAGGPALRLGAAMPFDLDDTRGVLAQEYATEPRLVALPVGAGRARAIAAPALAGMRWARWCAGQRFVVAGAAPARPPRIWRGDATGTLVPLTDEGVTGLGAVSGDGTRLAVIAGDRLLVIDIDGGEPRVVPGSFDGETVCGWHAGGADVFVRTRALPISVRRVTVATGASVPVVQITPPPLGRRGVYGFAIDAAGDAYAYSYGQELSRLYALTATDLG